MEILYVIAVMMLLLLVKGIYDKKKERERLKKHLFDTWGKLPKEEYTESKLKSLQFYYNNKQVTNQDNVFLLDDITWNDLDMTELYFMINNTGSAMGEEVLWAVLHELRTEEDSLKERENVISFFQNNEEARLKLQTDFSLIGKNNKISVFEYMDRMETVRRETNVLHFFCVAGIIISLIILLFGVGPAGIVFVGFIIFNLLTYYKRKGEIELYYSVITYLLRMLEYAEKISKEDCLELEPYFTDIKEHTLALKAFRKGAPAVMPQNPTGDMASFFLDYFRILFHSDLIRFNKMMKQYRENKERIIKVFEIIGFLDAMCAVASFRSMLSGYCIPEFKSKKQFFAEQLYHPFLEKPVPASIQTKKSVLLTGSNASGKSTFIKAAALNAILAQTIYTVCAQRYQCSFFKVFTSMAFTDNLFKNESYYIVEIKSLKRILDAFESEIPVLCFIDEVLRGTNTVERIAASSRILHFIANSNGLMFAATHDIELTYMLEQVIDNYHFEEQISGNEVIFDYELKIGRATSQNAIALLGMLGYPEEIIQKSKDAAKEFIDKGEWKAVTK